jgi:hypothetical protein
MTGIRSSIVNLQFEENMEYGKGKLNLIQGKLNLIPKIMFISYNTLGFSHFCRTSSCYEHTLC